jgi:uncharacterized repeat protein (TIGR01451 family)
MTPTVTFTFTATSTPTVTNTPTPSVQLLKTSSKTIAYAGDTVGYTLTLKISGSAATAVQVTDTLPSQVLFTGFGAPSPSVPGQTMGASGAVLTWNFPYLTPGTYLLPYSVKVNSGLLGLALVNTAQGSFTGGTSQPVTASVVVPGPIQVDISVYNETGEVVKIILDQTFAQLVGSFQLSAASITAVNGVVSIYIGGILVGSWNGTSQNGTPVTNGIYYIKVDNIDPFGTVTTLTQQVTVSRSISTLTVAVYNEAGEIVKHLATQVAAALNASIQTIQLSVGVIQPGNSTRSGLPGSTLIQVDIPGGGMTVAWNGTNDQGGIVTNGQYFVEAHWMNGQGGLDQTITAEVGVLNSGRGMVEGQVFAQPNLLAGGQTTTLIRVNSPLAMTLTAHFYSIAGESVGTAQGLPGTNQVPWDAAGLASGCYLAVVEFHGADGGILARQTTHLVVRR